MLGQTGLGFPHLWVSDFLKTNDFVAWLTNMICNAPEGKDTIVADWMSKAWSCVQDYKIAAQTMPNQTDLNPRQANDRDTRWKKPPTRPYYKLNVDAFIYSWFLEMDAYCLLLFLIVITCIYRYYCYMIAWCVHKSMKHHIYHLAPQMDLPNST